MKLGLLFINGVFSIIYPKLKSPLQKHLFSILGSLTILVFSPVMYIQFLVMAWISYGIIKFNKHAFWMPFVTTIFVLLFSLSSCGLMHLLRVNTFLYTTFQITMIMKIISFSWAVYDGHCNTKPLPLQQQRAIHEWGDSMSFFGFLLFFPTLFMGPMISFNQYQRMVQLKSPFSALQIGMSGMKTLIKTIIPLVLLSQFGPQYRLSLLLDPEYVKTTTPVSRFLFLNVCGFMIRCSTYVWFQFCLGCLHACGHDQQEHLEKHDTPLETYFKYWNPSANDWVNEEIYDRLVGFHVSPTTSALISYTVLAVFYGLHWGFLFSFCSLLLVQIATGLIQTHINRFSVLYPYYYVTSIIWTEISINYCIPPMVAKTLSNCFLIYSRTYFIGHFILLGICIVIYFKLRIAELENNIVRYSSSYMKRIKY